MIRRFPKKLIVLILLSIFIFFSVLLLLTIIKTRNASNLQYYTISGDDITSITNVVGKRKVSSLSSKTSDSMIYKQYTYYGMDSAVEDVQKYVGYLCDSDKFVADSLLNSNEENGEVTLYKKAFGSENKIILTIEYEIGRYKISLEKELR